MPTPNAETIDCSATRPVPRGRLSALGSALTAVLRKLAGALVTLTTARLDCRTMRGRERHSGLPLTLGYVGNGENLSYLAKLYLADWSEVVSASRIPWWRAVRMARRLRSDNDLVFLDLDFPLHWFTRWLAAGGCALSVPRWLKQTITVPVGTWNDMLPHIRRKTRNEARRMISKFGFKFDVVRGETAAREFYRDLYKPGVRARFGDEGIVVEERAFLAECAKGAIARVLRNGEVLAAVLVHFTERQLALKWFGARDLAARAEEIKGAADALDWYTLRLAVEAGLDAVDMGHCRPHLNDGVLRYKLKWGAVVHKGRMPKGRFQILAREFSPVVRSAFANNPLVAIEGGALVSRVLVPVANDTREGVDRTAKRYATAGLGTLKVFVDGDAGVHTSSCETGHGAMQIIDLADARDPLRRFLTA